MLCSECDSGFSRNSNYKCSKCPNHLQNIVRLVCILIIAIIVIVFLINSTLKGAKEKKNVTLTGKFKANNATYTMSYKQFIIDHNY